MKLSFGLQDKVCLVTGAASGIGQQAAAQLVAEGARVVVSDLRADALDAAFPQDDVLRVAADVSDPAAVDALMAAITGEHGHVDVLIHSAGVYSVETWSQVTPEGWHKLVDVNLHGSFLVAQGAMRLMEGRDQGAIVFVGSYAARTGGLRASAAYASAKAGVMGLTRHLAAHGGPLGIRVNCIHPGMIDTPMLDDLTPEAWKDGVGRVPLGRVGTPAEAAAMAVVLASDLASFVTAGQIDVSGGMFMA